MMDDEDRRRMQRQLKAAAEEEDARRLREQLKAAAEQVKSECGANIFPAPTLDIKPAVSPDTPRARDLWFQENRTRYSKRRNSR